MSTGEEERTIKNKTNRGRVLDNICICIYIFMYIKKLTVAKVATFLLIFYSLSSSSESHQALGGSSSGPAGITEGSLGSTVEGGACWARGGGADDGRHVQAVRARGEEPWWSRGGAKAAYRSR